MWKVQQLQSLHEALPGGSFSQAGCRLGNLRVPHVLQLLQRLPEDALAFRFRRAPALNRGPDIGRRALLGGLLAGVSLPLFGRLDGRVDKVEDPRLIRPPGALAEVDFLEVCQRCGLCMKVCPTNVINPTLAEAGCPVFGPRGSS